jgi:GNAT superfamily N-acetyltransferase
MLGYRLRPATAGDAEEVAAIWLAGWRESHLGRVPAALAAARTPESFSLRAAQRVGDTTVAVAGETVAGFVMISGDEVEQVYVSLNHRGTGVAAALLAEALRQIAAAGHRQSWLAVIAGNARARRFYERSGWTDEGAFDYEARTADGMILVRCHRYVRRS